MPRKRRSSPIAKQEARPAKKRRLSDNPDEEKDEEDIDMSTVDRGNMRLARRASFANVGGLIGDVVSNFEPQFQPGAIRRLRVKNWVTFDEANIHAVPGLNLIMGPNGTGKSSLVCAICMVLNGKTSTLGRVDRVGDFVKRGETRASIEIILEGGPGNPSIAIERHIKKAGSSVWKLNGKTANAKAVTDVVSKLQIKVDNLCQFLAQDRVVEFARLSPTNLLSQTLRAVASDDDDLVGQHQQLSEIQRDLNDREQEMKTVEANLTAANEELRGLETVISNFRSREQMKEKLEVIESRVAWAAVEEKAEEVKTTEENAENMKRAAREEEQKLRPLRNLSTTWQRKATAAKKKVDPAKKDHHSLLEKYKRLDKKHEKFNADMKEQREEIKELRKAAADQEKKRLKAEQNLAKARELFETMDPQTLEEARANMNRIRAELRKVRGEETKLRNKLRSLKSKMDECESELVHQRDRLKNLQNSSRRRDEAIYRGNKRHFKRFAAWVASHQHEFDGQVVGPIIGHVEVRNQLHASYLNTAINDRLQYAWILTTQKDWTRLSRECAKQNIQVLLLLTEPDSMQNYRRPCSVQVLRRNGAAGYLDETFDAPEIVKCVLCNQISLHSLAYSDDQLSVEQREALLAKSERQSNAVRRLYEPGDAWSVRFSRYGDRDAVTSNSFIRRIGNQDVGFHVTNDPTEDIERCRSQMQGHTEQLQEFEREHARVNKGMKPFSQKLNALNTEKKTWQDTEKDFKKAKNKVERCERKLNEVSEPIDIEREETKHRTNIRKMARSQLTATEKMIELLHELSTRQLAWRESSVMYDHAVVEKECAEERLKHSSHRLKTLKARVKEMMRQLGNLNRSLKELEATAIRTYPRRRWESHWTEDEHLSKTQAELEGAAEDLRSRIACVLCNEADVQRYKKLEREVTQFAKQLEESGESSRRFREQMIRLEETWRPKIREIVAKISRRFAELFRAFSANGEVHLREEELYIEWAIEIMTDFRPHTGEGLQPLSGYRQSGGERSVSTMLYLLSLQEVTTAPFRVVDEINQGMDPANERLIMDILNKECVPRSNREIPQYFVVTPKLLPRLQYSPHSAAFMIFNGPWVAPQSTWKMKEFLSEKASQD